MWKLTGVAVLFTVKREIQLALISSLDSNYKSNWNPENDYSREGLGKEFVRTEKIPLYLNGVKVFGNEPPQIEPSPTPSDGPGSTPPPSQKPSLEVLYKYGDTTAATKDIRGSIKIKNTGTKPVNLSRRKSTLLVYQRRGFQVRNLYAIMRICLKA